jgi:hypothetical protein
MARIAADAAAFAIQTSHVVLVLALLPNHPVDGNCTSDNIWQPLADVIHVENQVAQTLAVIP